MKKEQFNVTGMTCAASVNEVLYKEQRYEKRTV